MILSPIEVKKDSGNYLVCSLLKSKYGLKVVKIESEGFVSLKEAQAEIAGHISDPCPWGPKHITVLFEPRYMGEAAIEWKHCYNTFEHYPVIRGGCTVVPFKSSDFN